MADNPLVQLLLGAPSAAEGQGPSSLFRLMVPQGDWPNPNPPPDDAFERAAMRVRRTVGKKDGGDASRLAQAIYNLLVPQSLTDAALMAATGPFGRVGTRVAIGALGTALDPSEAQAGPLDKIVRGAVNQVQTIGRGGIINPVRSNYPGIYKPAVEVAQEAAAMTAPEHEALKQLFNVTRDDLYEIGGRGTREGNIAPSIATRANPRGSYAASQIMTGQNAERLFDALKASEKYAPDLIKGMDSWYVMDPAYWRLAELVGPENAKSYYNKFNVTTSMHSPGSDVLTELNRGTAANMMIERNAFDKYRQYGGTAQGNRGIDFPVELADVVGHPYHSTAHVGPLSKYVDTGVVNMTQPKVPLYMQASGVPETGFQTKLPVPDAHFTRAVGMADVRKNANPGASMKTPEYAPVGPWFREEVARPLGIEAVPAQARMWGLFAPQTGVDTAVGAPKLELLAQSIWDRAKKLGVDPRQLRDDVLLGKNHAVWALGLPSLGAVAASQQEWPSPERIEY